MPNRSVRDVIANRNHSLLPAGRRSAAQVMKEHNVGALMVVERGRLTGIFTERDALFRVLAEGARPRETDIADVMTTKPRRSIPIRRWARVAHDV